MRRIRNTNYTSRHDLVAGPTLTIHEAPPWLLTTPQSPSSAGRAEPRASSTYSDDLDALLTPMSETRQLGSPMSSPGLEQHEIADSSAAPQSRTSRLPIFKQVRSMLTNNRGDRGANNNTVNTSPTSAIKWDEYSGEISEHGKEAHVKPSTYKNPYEGILKSRHKSPTRKSRTASENNNLEVMQSRTGSPVSMLVQDDLQMLESEPGNMSPPNSRPVSPVSVERVAPLQLELPPSRPKTTGGLKRKPVASTAIENFPAAEVRTKPNSSHGLQSQGDETSRFSWTTAAPSEAPPRKSTDTRFSRQPEEQYNSSHFSWSTVASALPGAQREQTPPPSPPPVPLQYLEPPTYGPPPTQSILSRQRPYKRVDKPEWAPPPSSYTPRSLTPRVHRIEEHDTSTTPGADGKKRLPLPPLFTEKSLTHLEALLTQEKNILLQRRNVEKSIVELERVENASPLDVSFSVVREARKKLEERRKVLDEIRLEEMDVGIRIARARRKEDFGDGEGTFWVRRVTG